MRETASELERMCVWQRCLVTQCKVETAVKSWSWFLLYWLCDRVKEKGWKVDYQIIKIYVHKLFPACKEPVKSEFKQQSHAKGAVNESAEFIPLTRMDIINAASPKCINNSNLSWILYEVDQAQIIIIFCDGYCPRRRWRRWTGAEAADDAGTASGPSSGYLSFLSFQSSCGRIMPTWWRSAGVSIQIFILFLAIGELSYVGQSTISGESWVFLLLWSNTMCKSDNKY